MNRSWAVLTVGMLATTIAACAADEPAPPVRYSGPISECPTLNAPDVERQVDVSGDDRLMSAAATD